MINLTDIERIKFCTYFDDIVKTIRDQDRGSLEKIRQLMPIYTLDVNFRFDGSKDYGYSHRNFTALSLGKKGKRRVYTSQDEGKTRLFIFFLSKKWVTKLCRGNLNHNWAIEHLGDRWFITSDNYKFQNIFQLLNHVIAMEAVPKFENHPPTGKSPDVWMHSEAIVGFLSKYRSIKSCCHVYGLSVNKYSLDKEK